MAHGARPGAGGARSSLRRRQCDRGLRSLSGARHADRREDGERLDRRRRDPQSGRRDARRPALLECRRAGDPRAASVKGPAGPCRPPVGRDARARGPRGSTAARRTEVPGPVGRARSFEPTSSSCDSSTTSSRMSARKTGPWCSISNRSSSSSEIRSQSSAPLPKRLPADTGRVEVLQSDQLETAQDLTQLLNNLARFLWLVPLALFAIALWLARGRRRTTLRMVAIGLTAGRPARPARPQARR